VQPVDQTRFGDPDGNCLAACVASIFEVALEDVADFQASNWLIELNEWLAPRGLAHLCLSFRHGLDSTLMPGGFHLIGGPSRRGHNHSVVGHTGVIVHDPHPDRSGLERIIDYGFFIALRPETLRAEEKVKPPWRTS